MFWLSSYYFALFSSLLRNARLIEVGHQTRFNWKDLNPGTNYVPWGNLIVWVKMGKASSLLRRNNAYAKFGGTNKEYYGIFQSGLYSTWCKTTRAAENTSKTLPCTQLLLVVYSIKLHWTLYIVPIYFYWTHVLDICSRFLRSIQERCWMLMKCCQSLIIQILQWLGLSLKMKRLHFNSCKSLLLIMLVDLFG